MKNSNNLKILVVAALIVSAIALSLGFAAYSASLTIQSSAQVSSSQSNFNVSLSKSSTSASTGAVTPTVSGTSGATGSSASLTANKISGLKANFTNDGQSVVYSFYAYNGGEFAAYLNSVTIGSKTCTATSGTTQSYVDSACNGISISVSVNNTTYNATNTNISGHTLAKNASEPIIVTITYAENSAHADGDFNVAFGDIVLNYSTVD